MKLSVVVPCYNEEENIPLILDRFKEVIKDNNIEVILVNNGSTDGSAEVLRELLPDYSFAKTTLVEENQGYGYGILAGLNICSGDYVGWTHADMQTDPADIIKAYKLAEKSKEPVYVKGTRKGRPLFDVFFTEGMGIFESLYLGKRMADINAQPNIFPRSFYDSWVNPPYDFSLDLYAFYTARMQKLKVVRFPVLFPERIHGESKWNTGMASKWKFIKRTLEFSSKLKRNNL